MVQIKVVEKIETHIVC